MALAEKEFAPENTHIHRAQLREVRKGEYLSLYRAMRVPSTREREAEGSSMGLTGHEVSMVGFPETSEEATVLPHHTTLMRVFLHSNTNLKTAGSETSN